MCQPISGVMTKDFVFFGITDSHEDIIEQHKLHEGAGRVNILRFEITPPMGNFSAPLEQWTYRRDQDVFPKWHDEHYDEFRASAALVNSGLAPLYADYKAKRTPLDADYAAKRTSLYADYEAKRDPLYADYEAKCAPLYADYEAKRDPLDADYEAKRAKITAGPY